MPAIEYKEQHLKSAKLGIVALLIVAAIVFVIIRMRPSERGRRIVAQEMRRVIDVESGEVVEVTIGDWEEKFRRDPETQYKLDGDGRKLSDIRRCASCGEEIAQPAVPPGSDYRAILRDYRCPKCGNAASSRAEWEP